MAVQMQLSSADEVFNVTHHDQDVGELRQQELDELLQRFEQEHRDLADQLRAVPEPISLWQPALGVLAVTTGSTTERNDLAYMGSGTQANH